MRKDGKSSFQAKKEKLLKIKEIIQAIPDEDLLPRIMAYGNQEEDYRRRLEKIWELVKNEE